MSRFTVYPAIDVRAAAVVRLQRGDYARETRYPATPFGMACQYAAAGARWLHLVDLDAARSGGYGLYDLLRRIVADTALQVQTGGGVRTVEDVVRLLNAGATRVVVGSLAVRDPERVCSWIERFGADRIVVALDTRWVDGAWCLPVHGWREASGMELFPLLADYARAGLRHVLCTDIDRDGMLSGPNLTLYESLRARHPELALQASGGMRNLADLAAVRAAGCAGAIVGKSLLEGHLELGEALAC
jgi:phosphoribosylformimino-5-aminoimidazole carboxamide ribotide isomerase